MMHESNKCGIQFRCFDTKTDRCVHRLVIAEEYKGPITSCCKHQIGLNCTSLEAQTAAMTLKLKEK